MLHSLVYRSRFKVEEAVLEGGTPFDKVHGTSGFEYTGLDARLNEIFNKAMVDTSIIVIKEVLNSYHGFDNLKSLVDVGGGLGISLNMIISEYPKIKGINLDLPHVIQHAPQYPGMFIVMFLTKWNTFLVLLFVQV